MVKEAVLQVRMASEMKTRAENLFRKMGTSFPEAVRIFTEQSLLLGAMPFVIQSPERARAASFGRLAAYANPGLKSKEKESFQAAMKVKYANAR